MIRAALLIAMLASAVPAMAGTGQIIIINEDRPGTGFNDSTPAAPIGGNPGTTLGQQRLNVFRAAAEHWQKLLDTNVDIEVSATFAPIIGCTQSEGILGQAAPMLWRHSFPGAPRENVWYPIALANKLAGTDLEPTTTDIFVQFNASVDNSTCLGTSDWYYGFDGEHGSDIDLYVVVLHELAHGLGISGATGNTDFKENRPAVFDTHAFDLTLGLRWDQMSPEQRRISQTNTGSLVWDGDFVRNANNRYLVPVTTLTITEPASLARNYDIGLASFGAPAGSTAVSGKIVQAVDEANSAGPTTADACTAFTNADAVRGNIAIVDRRGCKFTAKARNAQAAGATALIIVDRPDPENPADDSCTPPAPGFLDEDPSDITIPVIGVTRRDGDLIKAQLNAGVRGTLRVDPAQLAGATTPGYTRLYAPCSVEPGSSTHHWDKTASPNLLMEPDINFDLTHDVDLTLYQLLDMGWTTRTGRTILKRK